MKTDRYRELNFYSYCLGRDSDHMDTYDPKYFPQLEATWKNYKRLGLDVLLEPTPAGRAEWDKI